VLQVFEKAREEIWQIAGSVLNSHQQEILKKLIRNWQSLHPNQIAVEAVRISDFAVQSGMHEKELKDQASGLLSSVKSATIAADQALLLGERSLYYAQMAPFLWRLHAKAALSELMDSAVLQLAHFPVSTQEMNLLLNTAGRAAQDTTLLVNQFQKLLDLIYKNKNNELFQIGNESIQGMFQLLKEYNKILLSNDHAENLKKLSGISNSIESILNRLLIKIILVSVFLISFAGGTVFVSRVAFSKWSASRGPKNTGMGPPSGRQAA
jgi:hypothetical protein